MKQFVISIILMIFTVLSAQAEAGDTWSKKVIRGRTGYMVVHSRTGLPMTCAGWIEGYDEYGNIFRHEGAFFFSRGDYGPHGLAVGSTVANMVDITYYYECYRD